MQIQRKAWSRCGGWPEALAQKASRQTKVNWPIIDLYNYAWRARGGIGLSLIRLRPQIAWSGIYVNYWDENWFYLWDASFAVEMPSLCSLAQPYNWLMIQSQFNKVANDIALSSCLIQLEASLNLALIALRGWGSHLSPVIFLDWSGVDLSLNPLHPASKLFDSRSSMEL